MGSSSARSARSRHSTRTRKTSPSRGRRIQIVRLIAKMPTIAAFAFRGSRGLPYCYLKTISLRRKFLNMTWKTQLKHRPTGLQRALRSCSSCTPTRAELLDEHRPRRRLVAGRSLLGRGGGIAALYGPLQGGANERSCGCSTRSATRRTSGLHRAGQGREGSPDGLRPPRVQELRPRAKLIKRMLTTSSSDRPEPEARVALESSDRARGRVLRLAQALSERRLLLPAHLPGDRLPQGLLHGAVFPRPAARLDRAVRGAPLRPRAEDPRPRQVYTGEAERPVRAPPGALLAALADR